MTVKQYKTIYFLKENFEGEELLKKILEMTYKDNPNITLDESKRLLESFNNSRLKKTDSLIQTFWYDNVEYGIIPDFDLIKTKEFLDIDQYEKSVDNIHKLLAVLYRPVKSRLGKYYEIEEYQGSKKYADIMENVDIEIYISVVNFFLALFQKLLEKDLNTYSTKKKGKKKKTDQKD